MIKWNLFTLSLINVIVYLVNFLFLVMKNMKTKTLLFVSHAFVWIILYLVIPAKHILFSSLLDCSGSSPVFLLLLKSCCNLKHFDKIILLKRAWGTDLINVCIFDHENSNFYGALVFLYR